MGNAKPMTDAELAKMGKRRCPVCHGEKALDAKNFKGLEVPQYPGVPFESVPKHLHRFDRVCRQCRSDRAALTAGMMNGMTPGESRRRLDDMQTAKTDPILTAPADAWRE